MAAVQLHLHRLGDPGLPPLVLVHGSLLDGIRTWAAQRPLATRFGLLILDRRGHGGTPLPARAGPGEDFESDAADLVELLAALPDGAHLAGHSYGGLVALLAAGARPDLIRSLTVVEPPAFGVARGEPPVEAFIDRMVDLMRQAPSLDPEAFLAGFLAAVGVSPPPPGPLSPTLLGGLRLLAASRPPWEARVPLEALTAARVPLLAVTGGHDDAYEAVADRLSQALGGERLVVSGWGHAVPYAGEAFNDPLAAFVAAAEERWIARPSAAKPAAAAS